jgi:hypothetical protein
MTKIRRSRLAFGGPGTFAEAFPEVEVIEVKVAQPDSNWDTSFNKANPPGHYIKCPNPLCRSGRFYIGNILGEMVSKHETYRKASFICLGREGTGRKTSRPCLRPFRYEIKIEYKASA